MKGREELFSFKIPAPSGPGAKIGRPRPSTTATPRKLPLHSHSAFKPFAHYSDRLLALGCLLAVNSFAQEKAKGKAKSYTFHGKVEAITDKGLTVNGERSRAGWL